MSSFGWPEILFLLRSAGWTLVLTAVAFAIGALIAMTLPAVADSCEKRQFEGKSYAVCTVYIESCAMFVRGGVMFIHLGALHCPGRVVRAPHPRP